MARKKDELEKVHETDGYVHYAFPGVKSEDFNEDGFQTVNIAGGHKMIIGRTKKNNELSACRLLVKKKG